MQLVKPISSFNRQWSRLDEFQTCPDEIGQIKNSNSSGRLRTNTVVAKSSKIEPVRLRRPSIQTCLDEFTSPDECRQTNSKNRPGKFQNLPRPSTDEFGRIANSDMFGRIANSSGRVRTKCATNCKLVRTRCTVDCKLQYSNPSVDRRWTHVRTSSDGLQIPPFPLTVLSIKSEIIGRVRSQLRTNCKLHPQELQFVRTHPSTDVVDFETCPDDFLNSSVCIRPDS